MEVQRPPAPVVYDEVMSLLKELQDQKWENKYYEATDRLATIEKAHLHTLNAEDDSEIVGDFYLRLYTEEDTSEIVYATVLPIANLLKTTTPWEWSNTTWAYNKESGLHELRFISEKLFLPSIRMDVTYNRTLQMGDIK
ncbi:hypothetical protein GF389_02415 [Candidatus Dojkabacteria bacterium]|nr:hypothetical protein [Candidatus Dojkabacteria bacterium]